MGMNEFVKDPKTCAGLNGRDGCTCLRVLYR
jgi:hypothetical protein